MPATPGTLSLLSPAKDWTSTTFSGFTPNFLNMSSSLINLFLTYSRGSYIAFLFGLVWLLLFSQLLNKKIKIFVIVFLTFLSGFLVFAFPSVFLKQSNL